MSGKAWNGTIEEVDPAVIVTDHRYQRDRKPGLIETIAANPDPRVFGVPIVVKRAGTTDIYYCVDGQQRLAGILGSEKPPRLIYVNVVETVTLADEAEVFVRINEWRKALTPIEKHLGKGAAEDPAAVAVQRAIDTAGFTVAKTTSPRALGSIGGAYYVYGIGGEEGLLQTLLVLRDAWPDDKKSTNTWLLRVIGEIVCTQNGGYNRKKLTEALTKSTPAAIFRKSEEIHFEQGTSGKESLRRAIKALCKV